MKKKNILFVMYKATSELDFILPFVCKIKKEVVSRVVCKLSEVLHWPSLPIFIDHLN